MYLYMFMQIYRQTNPTFHWINSCSLNRPLYSYLFVQSEHTLNPIRQCESSCQTYYSAPYYFVICSCNLLYNNQHSRRKRVFFLLFHTASFLPLALRYSTPYRLLASELRFFICTSQIPSSVLVTYISTLVWGLLTEFFPAFSIPKHRFVCIVIPLLHSLNYPHSDWQNENLFWIVQYIWHLIRISQIEPYFLFCYNCTDDFFAEITCLTWWRLNTSAILWACQ